MRYFNCHLVNIGMYYFSKSFSDYMSKNGKDHCSKLASPRCKGPSRRHPQDDVRETDADSRGDGQKFTGLHRTVSLVSLNSYLQLKQYSINKPGPHTHNSKNRSEIASLFLNSSDDPDGQRGSARLVTWCVSPARAEPPPSTQTPR